MFFIIQVIVIVGFFGGLALLLQNNEFFLIFLGAAFVLIILPVTLRFFSTHYFLTDKKFYKKTGFLLQNVVEVERDDVTDIRVNQGFFERFVFLTGTLLINTAGSPEIEMALPRVQRPFQRKKDIEGLWSL